MNKRLILTLALLAVVSQAPGEPLVNLSAEQRTSFGIETAQARRVDTSFSKAYPGKVVVPNAQLQVVGAPLDGVVQALLVAEGESVQAGQPLAQVRSQALLELQAAFLESHTRQVLAANTLERDRKLHSEGIIAERRLLESQAAYREQRTAEERDQQALALAGMSDAALKALADKKKLDAVLQVQSPLSGVVLSQVATVGQRLAASDPIYQVGDLSTLWVEVHVPIDELGPIAPGHRMQLPDALVAEVITVGRMVHSADQGVLVRAELRKGAEKLRPGQFIEAQIGQAAGGDALKVLAGAVVRIEGKDSVFIEGPQGFVVMAVEVLASDATEVVVRGKLQPGDAVAVAGTAALKAALGGGAE